MPQAHVVDVIRGMNCCHDVSRRGAQRMNKATAPIDGIRTCRRGHLGLVINQDSIPCITNGDCLIGFLQFKGTGLCQAERTQQDNGKLSAVGHREG
jgi:hypothetical protein